MQSFHFLMRGEIVSCSTIWNLWYPKIVSILCTVSKKLLKSYKLRLKSISRCQKISAFRHHRAALLPVLLHHKLQLRISLPGIDARIIHDVKIQRTAFSTVQSVQRSLSVFFRRIGFEIVLSAKIHHLPAFLLAVLHRKTKHISCFAERTSRNKLQIFLCKYRLRIACSKGLQQFQLLHRWEERRVGKECRSRWSPYH